MTCTQRADDLQLWLSGQLPEERRAELERHLGSCAACRDELALLVTVRTALAAPASAEPAYLTDRILRRVAVYEVERAQLAAVRRVFALRAASVLVALLVAVAVFQPVLWSEATQSLSHTLADLYQTLMMPGPNSIAWSVWFLGALLMLAVAFVALRTDVSASWRRSVSERLPQLW